MASRLAIVDVDPGPEGERRALDAIARHAADEGAGRLLVGLPLDMNGFEGKSAARARRFGERLAERTGLPVTFADERLTSEEAEAAARQTGWTPKSGKPIDDIAAALLLQGWLDDERARAARAALDEPAGGGA